METEEPQNEDTTSGDESVEEFKEQVENDPSTAKASTDEDDSVERLRGG